MGGAAPFANGTGLSKAGLSAIFVMSKALNLWNRLASDSYRLALLVLRALNLSSAQRGYLTCALRNKALNLWNQITSDSNRLAL